MISKAEKVSHIKIITLQCGKQIANSKTAQILSLAGYFREIGVILLGILRVQVFRFWVLSIGVLNIGGI